MKNIVNFRLIFFCFVALLTAILFGKHFVSGNITYIIFFSCLLLTLIIIAIIRKKIWQTCAILLSFIIGFCSFYLDISRFDNIKAYSGEQLISGRVISIKNYNQSQSVVLGNVTIEGLSDANISVYVPSGTLEIGDKIIFNSDLEIAYLFSLGSFQNYIYTNNIHYTTTIDADNIASLSKTSLTFSEQVRKSVNNLFNKFMSEDIAQVSYSALFGDKGNLSSDISDAFTISGISHILSVSGMHVAFLILIIDWILKKFKLNTKARFILFAIILSFYVYLCDFQVTVIRATIMGLVLILSNMLGKQYDSLNSLGLAGILILLINPLSAFSIGFQLSFLCVFIIALFSGKLTNLLMKIKLPQKISSLLAMTICIQLGLLPIIAKYFGTISFLSIFTNLLCVPLFEIAFILTIILIIPVMIFSFLGFFLTFTSFIYQIVVSIATFISKQTWAILTLCSISDFALMLFYVAIFFLSGFVLIKFKQKSIVCMVLLIISLGFTYFSALPSKYNNFTIMQINNYSVDTIILSESGESILISDLSNISTTEKFLQQAKIYNLTTLIHLNTSLTEEQNTFVSYYSIQNVLSVSQTYSDDNLSINPLLVGLNTYVMFFEVDGHNVMYLKDELTSFQNDVLNDYLSDKVVNLVINKEQLDFEIDCDFEINQSELKTNNDTYNKLNNWLFDIKNGKLNKVWSLN